MRHRKSGRQLNRNSSHRSAMFQNMVVSLFRKEIISTTLAKAKELRGFAEPLITLAKQDSVANRRIAFNRLRDKVAVGKLFNELGARYSNRPGGYLRVLKTGFRPGDTAPMALVELVGQAERKAELLEKKAPKKVAAKNKAASTKKVIKAETTETEEKTAK